MTAYTPTIRALRYARERADRVTGPARSLVVAMPTTPGLPKLPLHQALTEAEAVTELLPDPRALIERTAHARESGPAEAPAEARPTRSTVLTELARRGVVHFACHGVQDAEDPTRSRLLLHDHAEAPLDVASLAGIDLDGARLAYLSACETALTTTHGLRDEALHLAAAFQLIGFPHVVGTMWTLDDEVAVEIAEEFYTALRTDDGGFDAGRAASALHDAVRRQRDRFPATPSLWAAHVYVGA